MIIQSQVARGAQALDCTSVRNMRHTNVVWFCHCKYTCNVVEILKIGDNSVWVGLRAGVYSKWQMEFHCESNSQASSV